MFVKPDVAKDRIYSIFLNLSVPKEQSGIISETLVLSEMAGITTHGFRMIPDYVKKIEMRQFNLNPNFNLISDTESFSIIDCDNAIGLYSANIVLDKAIERAKRTGMYCIWCRNANTFGAAFPILEKCIAEGLIGICFANSPAQMAPLNGLERLFGTNPLAICIPTKTEYPFVLDMSTSIVAKSKINEARDKNEKIPYGWALDENGNQTDDPFEAQKGFLLPMAGAKGYGMSMAIDIFAGFLSGASFMDRVGRFYSDDCKGMDVGQFFMVIDPIKIYGDDYFNDFDNYLRYVYSSKSFNGERIKYPGVGKYERISESREGIFIEDTLYNELQKLGW